MRQKKGQITVYIIIGIIALVSVGVFMYIRSVKVEAPVTYRPTIEEVPVIAEPIRLFVTSCLEQVAQDGIKKVGDYGGYASPESMTAVVNEMDPTDGNAVRFSPGSDLVIPYWWHMKGPNNCEAKGNCAFASQRPNLYRAEGSPSIEGELDEYINNNLRACLRDFVDLADHGFEISEAGEINTKTVVTQKSVAFHVNYPLVARKGGETFNLNEYFVDIPIELKKVYELATEITNLEIEYSFLENYVNMLISIFSGLDKPLPPKSRSTIGDYGKDQYWQKRQVKQSLMQILTAYIPLLRVFNTQNAWVIAPGLEEEHRFTKYVLYNTPVVPVEGDYWNYTVSFTYLDWWGMYFDLDCNGELCQPDSVTMQFPLVGNMLGIKQYRFAYDVSAPVLVDISTGSALNGTGYSFKFFLESNLRNNREINPNVSLPQQTLEFEGTMFGDPDQRHSAPVKVVARDAFTGDPLEDVIISFSCGADSVKIGQTAASGEVLAKFPMCIGGMVLANRDNYHGASVGFEPSMKVEKEVKVLLHPYRYKDIEVRKYRLIKSCLVPMNASSYLSKAICNWRLENTPLPLTSTEEAQVMLVKHTEPGEPSFTASANYLGDRTAEDLSEDIKIIPGLYDIEIFTLNYAPISIPDDERCESTGLFDEECYDIDGVQFDRKNPFFSGGASIKDVALPATRIETNDKIVLYAITVALEQTPLDYRVIEDMEMPNEAVESYPKMYRNLLMPTYEKEERIQLRGETTTPIEGDVES
jgi:hypothetical protein